MPRRKSAGDKPDRPKPLLRPLGAQLRRLRLERDLTQEGLAERAGMNHKYLGRLERARAEPGAGVLIRLARALAVPVGELFATMNPGDSSRRGFVPADLDDLSSALAVMTAIVDRVRKGQPRPLSTRATRRRR